MSKKNYVFDLYGTLIDLACDEHAAQTWKKWCRELDKRGIKHPVYYKFRKDFFDLDKSSRVALKEKTGCDVPEIDIINVYRELFDRYGNGILDNELLNEISYEFRAASRSYIRLYPGVVMYLNKLREEGNKIFLLSNAQRSYTWPEIEMFELDKLTDDQFISSDYGCMKPDRRFFDALINKYDLIREDTIMHGDSFSSDIEGAIGAEIKYVYLNGDDSADKYYLKQVGKI